MNSGQVMTIRIDRELEADIDTALEIEPELKKSELIRKALREYIKTRIISRTGESWSVDVPPKLAELYHIILEGGAHIDMNHLMVEAMDAYAETVLTKGDRITTLMEKASAQRDENQKIIAKNESVLIYQKK